MKNLWKWILGALLALFVAVPALFMLGRFLMLGAFRWGGRGFFPRYPGMMGPGFNHMQPFGVWGGSWMWLVPLGFLILLVVGVYVLVRALNKPSASPAPAVSAVSANAGSIQASPEVVPSRACANCGRAAEAEWKVCPYCTEPLA